MEGIKTMRVSRYAKLTLFGGSCLALLWLFAAQADDVVNVRTVEKIPELEAIPDNFHGEERAQLIQQRQALESQLAGLKLAYANYNAKTADEQTDAELKTIEGMRKDYISAAKTFNEALQAAINAEITSLQNQFEDLTQRIEQDRQVIQSFGFNKNVSEIEYYGNLPTRQVEDAKNEFRKMLFDATLDSASQVAGVIGSLTPDEVDALNRLADAQGAPSLGIVDGANNIHTVLEFLKKTKSAYETVDDIKKGQMLDAAVKLAGLASKNPAFGLLLTADEWAGYQVYQSANAVKMVRDLTKANEGDLILLKSRSEKLKNEVNQLTAVKKDLAGLSAQGDSSNLVRKPE